MIAFGSFALLRPWWLAALPAVALLWRFARREEGGLAAWVRAVEPHLLAAMKRRGGVIAGDRKGATVTAALAVVLVVALSGPAWLRPRMDRFRNLDATLVLLDLSRAGTVAQAKTAALGVIAASAGRQLGVIVYAGDAYLATPLTDDVASAQAIVFAADRQTVPDYGVRPDRALQLARDIVDENRIVQADIVLIASGAGIGPTSLGTARKLAALGHAIHAVRLGDGKDGDDNEGNALAALASVGGGVSTGFHDIAALSKLLADRPVLHAASSPLQVIAWQDLGRFLLPAAMLPLLLLFRRTA